jgi:hypothetical protein
MSLLENVVTPVTRPETPGNFESESFSKFRIAKWGLTDTNDRVALHGI